MYFVPIPIVLHFLKKTPFPSLPHLLTFLPSSSRYILDSSPSISGASFLNPKVLKLSFTTAKIQTSLTLSQLREYGLPCYMAASFLGVS
jgi:hypothetical protein